MRSIIIPAYNPDGQLLRLLGEMEKLGDQEIIIVNDGSDDAHMPIFSELGDRYTVLHHEVNKGKGAALKTGFRFLLNNSSCIGCVTADADGQHAPKDILAVLGALSEYPNDIIMGSRDFSGAQVPFRSRWGNRITAGIFRLVTHHRCDDTQTGLRGIPRALMEDFCDVPGERFEFEMQALMHAARKGVHIRPVPIDTIYINENQGSHFHSLRDSFKVYGQFLRYALSSLTGALVDIGAFAVFLNLFGQGATRILFSTVIARCISGIVNFVINKKWVFKSDGDTSREAGKYLLLFLVQMFLSAGLTSALSSWLPEIGAKIIVDSCLFIISYLVQRKYVYTKKNRAKA